MLSAFHHGQAQCKQPTSQLDTAGHSAWGAQCVQPKLPAKGASSFAFVSEMDEEMAPKVFNQEVRPDLIPIALAVKNHWQSLLSNVVTAHFSYATPSAQCAPAPDAETGAYPFCVLF